MENTAKRFDDYKIYQMLCDYLWIHENRRKAVFGIGDFYEHGKQLFETPEYMYRLRKPQAYLFHALFAN